LLSNEFYPSHNTPKSMSAGALPQTPLGEHTALLQILYGPLRGRREWRGGREGLGGGGEGKGRERGDGEGGKKGEVWRGMAPCR